MGLNFKKPNKAKSFPSTIALIGSGKMGKSQIAGGLTKEMSEAGLRATYIVLPPYDGGADFCEGAFVTTFEDYFSDTSNYQKGLGAGMPWYTYHHHFIKMIEELELAAANGDKPDCLIWGDITQLETLAAIHATVEHSKTSKGKNWNYKHGKVKSNYTYKKKDYFQPDDADFSSIINVPGEQGAGWVRLREVFLDLVRRIASCAVQTVFIGHYKTNKAVVVNEEVATVKSLAIQGKTANLFSQWIDCMLFLDIDPNDKNKRVFIEPDGDETMVSSRTDLTIPYVISEKVGPEIKTNWEGFIFEGENSSKKVSTKLVKDDVKS